MICLVLVTFVYNHLFCLEHCVWK